MFAARGEYTYIVGGVMICSYINLYIIMIRSYARTLVASWLLYVPTSSNYIASHYCYYFHCYHYATKIRWVAITQLIKNKNGGTVINIPSR